MKVGGIFVHKGRVRCLDQKDTLATEALLPSPPLPPEKRAEAQALAQAIRQATDAEIEALARRLLASDAAHRFGATAFQVRDLAHKIAAQAYAPHLARKKTATRVPA